MGVAETTVRAWIRDGKLPAMTNGNPHLPRLQTIYDLGWPVRAGN